MHNTELFGWQDRLQSLPIAICVCDSHWTILFRNRYAESYLRGIAGHCRGENANAAPYCFFDLWPREAQPDIRNRLSRLSPSPPANRRATHLRLPSPCRTFSEIDIAIESFDVAGQTYWQIALREPQRQLSSVVPDSRLLDALHNAVFVWRFVDGAIQYLNPAAERMYGYSTAQASQTSIDSLLSQAGGSRLDLFREQLLAEGRWSGELIHRTLTGARLAVQSSMTLLDLHGSLCVLESNHDLTARHNAEKAFRFHFDLNRSITDHAVDPIFVVGSKGDIIFANPEAERVFGWSAEQLTGKSLHVMLHHHAPDGNDLERQECPLWWAQVRGEVLRSLELTFFHKQGHPIHVSCSNSPLLFENQELGAVLIARDITRQKQMEQALAESEERLRLAVESSNIGAWDLSLLSGAVALDDTSRTALGLEPNSEARLGSWLRSVHPDDRALARQQLRSALSPEGNGHFLLECRTVSRSDQRLRYVQARGQAFFADSKRREPVRMVGTLQDITERKRAEEALKQANQDLQQFAYAAAHDLQEPLRNVVNLLGLYKRNLSSTVQTEGDLIDLSIGDARRMHQMIRDLLSFTEVHKVNEEPLGLIESEIILRDAMKNLSSLVEEAGAVVEADGLPSVRVQPAHMLQLFQNTLSNALKYRRTDVSCKIRVSARRRGADWVFSIADNGIGFDNSYAERIFGMFKRLHGRYEYPGSGIGLAICSRIVQFYGGRIWAEGEVGKGATFFFTLPAVTHLW